MPHYRYIIIPIVVVAALIFGAVRSYTCHFECSNCGEHFQVNFFKYIFTIKSLGRRYVTCPKCKKSDYLMPRSGKK